MTLLDEAQARLEADRAEATQRRDERRAQNKHDAAERFQEVFAVEPDKVRWSERTLDVACGGNGRLGSTRDLAALIDHDGIRFATTHEGYPEKRPYLRVILTCPHCGDEYLSYWTLGVSAVTNRTAEDQHAYAVEGLAKCLNQSDYFGQHECAESTRAQRLATAAAWLAQYGRPDLGNEVERYAAIVASGSES